MSLLPYNSYMQSIKNNINLILYKGAENKKIKMRGTWVAQFVEQLPLAQVMILESRDQVPHPAPCSAWDGGVGGWSASLSDLLPLMLSLSHSLSLSNR